MTQELRTLSTLVLAILGLVSQRPMSGYDLRKLFSTTAMGHFSDSPGAIYPALKRCERDGWVKGTLQNVKSLRPRQVFSLTRRGRTVLEAHLSRPVTREDIIRRPGELILRFAFSGEILGVRRTRKFVREYLSEIEGYLGELREQARENRDRFTTCSRLALEHGVEGYEMEARWARRALKEL
jgi:DNA-binding PadR family transcriptional regulator